MNAVPGPPGPGAMRCRVSVQWLPRHSWLVRRVGGWRRAGSVPELPDGLHSLGDLDLGDAGGIFAAIAAIAAIVLAMLGAILVGMAKSATGSSHRAPGSSQVQDLTASRRRVGHV